LGDRSNLHPVTHSQSDGVNQSQQQGHTFSPPKISPLVTPDNLAQNLLSPRTFELFKILKIFPTHNEIVSKTAPRLGFSQANLNCGSEKIRRLRKS